MKQVTAFFLAIIYLGFTTGMVWTMSHTGEYAFEEKIVKESKDNSPKAYTKYAGGSRLTKAHKHLAAIGKIKIPRPGSAPSSSAAFTAYRSAGQTAQKLALVSPIIPQISLFIKNCVFLI